MCGLTGINTISLYLCADMVREFSKVIQLPVLFLEKGSYTYTVNDDLSGTFELPRI
jgi:hypothetical protein